MVVFLYVGNAALDQSGELPSGRTRVYSKKLSSMVAICWDTEKQFYYIYLSECKNVVVNMGLDVYGTEYRGRMGHSIMCMGLNTEVV